MKKQSFSDFMHNPDPEVMLSVAREASEEQRKMLNTKDSETTQRFIEDAVKGGWKSALLATRNFPIKDGKVTLRYVDHEWDGKEKWSKQFTVEQILLDPLAWQAVGKTRRWEQLRVDETGIEELYGSEHYKIKMSIFMRHLADGKSIEDSLAELTK